MASIFENGHFRELTELRQKSGLVMRPYARIVRRCYTDDGVDVGMPKDTLRQVVDRHNKEIVAFKKNCKHENVTVYQGSDTGGVPIWSVVGAYGNKPTGRYFMIKCDDCGTPMASVELGKLYAYITPHYVSKEVLS
jgi:hypothetical protein